MKQLLPSEKLRIVAFFSGNASALRYVLEKGGESELFKYRIFGKSGVSKYKIVGAFTDNKAAAGIKAVSEAGVKVKCLDFIDWCRLYDKKTGDFKARKKYFKEVSEFIKPFKAHLIMLSGFMLVITDPLLHEYKWRIVNIHPADLSVRGKDGRRKYVGKNAVAKVIAAGEKEIRATTHFVTDEVDGGPIIRMSNSIDIRPDDTPESLQERLKEMNEGFLYEWTLYDLAKYAREKLNGILLWHIVCKNRHPDLEAGGALLRSCIR